MTRGITVFSLALICAGPTWAGGPDLAALFPAGTLAYVELSRPAETADALAALLKSSPLADVVPFTHDRLDAAADAQHTPAVLRVARLGLLGSPEVLTELRKIRGAAVGLTGFTPRGEPKLSAAVLLGDSALLSLAARAFLSSTPDLRRVATADGVPVFQYRAFVGPLVGPDGKPFGPDDEANPLRGRTPTPGAGEPTFALAPGLFVAGSGVDEVADVLRRSAGKGTGPALDTVEGFGPAIRNRGPGLFGVASPVALFEAFDAAHKAADPGGVAWARFLLNPKAVRRATARFHISADVLALAADFDAVPGVPCPLFDLLAGGPATGVPPVAPGDAAWAVTVSLPASGRTGAVLAVTDAVAKAAGVVGRLPSDAAKTDGPDLSQELFADVSALAVFLPAKLGSWPVLAVHAESPAAADRWQRAVPGLVKRVGGLDAAPVPSAETVAGVRVRTVPGASLSGVTAVHWAVGGTTVVVGPDREAVAAAANRAAAGGPPVAGTVAVVRPVGLSAQFFPSPAGPKAVPSAGPEPRLLPGFTPFGFGLPGLGEPFAVGVGRAARHLPPVTVSVTRSGGVVRVAAEQRGLAKPVGAAVRDFLLWLETRPADAGDPHEPPIPDRN